MGLAEEFKSNPKRFWSFLKCAKGGSKCVSVLSVDGVEIVDDREKANALNSAFASKFTVAYVNELPECPSYNLQLQLQDEKISCAR